MKKILTSFLILFVIFFTSCSSGLSGTYTSSGENGFGSFAIDKIEFVSNTKAKITIMGVVQEIEYKLNGKELKFINGNENQIFTIDANGCIDGGEVLGKFCK